MGFASAWLEAGFQRWKRTSGETAARHALLAVGGAALARAAAHAPAWTATRAICIAVAALIVHLGIVLRKEQWVLWRSLTVSILFCDCLLSLPTVNALLPALLAVFTTYSLLPFPFYVTFATTVLLSIVQTCFFVVYMQPLRLNQLLATVLVHIWAHFVGIYIHIATERLLRTTFLSGRNAIETEIATIQHSERLNRLLSAFLPAHLISSARHQITLYSPHIYAEHYTQVTIGYGRLVGFETALSQCSSLDAATVLKELDKRILELTEMHGCTRIPSEGITVVATIPGIDSDHALKLCRFSLDLEAMIMSFREVTGAEVGVCVGIDSGTVTGGVVGQTKWHYDLLGGTVDNAILLQSNAPANGVYITDDTRRYLGSEFQLLKAGECWRLEPTRLGALSFPINKRFSMVTVPQSINRLLQTVAARDGSVKNNQNNKKKKLEKSKEEEFGGKKEKSFMRPLTLTFLNKNMEDEYHSGMDDWFIPALAISIFFLVVYGVYHMLVMPKLLTSLALIIVALTIMFFILLMLYINYFQSFCQFITRTASGHSVTVLIFLSLLLLSGIVNTFSCPIEGSPDICPSIHYSALSFALWIITTAVFLRFCSILLLFALSISLFVYLIQIAVAHPSIGPTQFLVESDLLCRLASLIFLVFLHARRCETLIRLHFLSVVKGVEDATSKDRLLLLNSQVLLNLVPAHVAPWIFSRVNDLCHHAYHSVGVAYLAVSGFDLNGEVGMTGLNYVFSCFDQLLSNFRGIEKIENSNRFYVVAVGMLPDTAQNVDDTPWTIGELLNTLVQFLVHATKFAAEKEFEVQIGLDCGSSLALVMDPERPKYSLWGETVERSRLLMQSANQGKILVSEEIYLALRPRNLRFSTHPVKFVSNLNAYTLYAFDDEPRSQLVTLPKEDQEKHTQRMVDKARQDPGQDDFASSMASSFSSELASIEDGAETDSDIEWITAETALMASNSAAIPSTSNGFPSNREQYRPQDQRRSDYRQMGSNYRSLDHNTNYKAEQAVQYSDWSEQETSRAQSRNDVRNPKGKRRWRSSSRGSLFSFLKRGESDAESVDDPHERLEAAAMRVEKMLHELNTYGNFAELKPLEYRPFPTQQQFGSMKSMNRPLSSACHTEYDNAESDAALSDFEGARTSQTTQDDSGQRRRDKRRRRWGGEGRGGCDADTESQCSSRPDSRNDQYRWKQSVHSIGYENEYEVASDSEGLAVDEMRALSRDIRRNFGDFKLSTFDDIDQD